MIFLPLRPRVGDSAIAGATPRQQERKNQREEGADAPPTKETLSGFRGAGRGGGRLSIPLLGFSITARQRATEGSTTTTSLRGDSPSDGGGAGAGAAGGAAAAGRRAARRAESKSKQSCNGRIRTRVV